MSSALGAPSAPAPESNEASGAPCGVHLPSTVTSTQYWGDVAASSRWNTAFEETPTVGLPGTSTTQANPRGGPVYWIWTIAVTVESGLSTSRIFRGERSVRAFCEAPCA